MISLSGAISIRQASQWPLLRTLRHIGRVVERGGELQGPKVKWRQGGWEGEGGTAKSIKEARGRLKKTKAEKRRYRVRKTERVRWVKKTKTERDRARFRLSHLGTKIWMETK